jgi:hypothetical protein
MNLVNWIKSRLLFGFFALKPLSVADRGRGRREMSEWISVDERLPPTKDGFKTSEIVLGYRNGGIDFYRRHLEMPWGWVHCSDWRWGKPQITHWMPLPEPPKEQDVLKEGE